MRKLRLDVEAVQVESFTTQAAAAGRGTVEAQQGRETFGCPAPTQDTCVGTCGCGGGTLDVTCASCDITCGATCWDPTCDTCMATCNYATGPERCCAV
ncbi:MAG TPA: hypothetical protein VGC13_30280 [Longimicrobium sp.]|jgi:hypothetical protein|uniref:hypothetical protein n=1 Tax=Longimicrobium sp. TaxID=2029185 RepID=UPI002ED8960C